jgi:hypothetical protein
MALRTSRTIIITMRSLVIGRRGAMEARNTPVSIEEIAATFRRMCRSGDVHELRALGTARGTVSGYFDNPEAFARAAAGWNGRAQGIYMTLNAVTPRLLDRARNRVVERAKYTTADSEIALRRWIPLDFDPIRPSGVVSTDEEHRAAIGRAAQAKEWLVSQGVDHSSLFVADSGNGAHVLMHVDLDCSERSTDIVRRVIEAVSFQFSDDLVKVDSSVYNAARIWKVYGTWACKGEGARKAVLLS